MYFPDLDKAADKCWLQIEGTMAAGFREDQIQEMAELHEALTNANVNVDTMSVG